MYIDIRALRSIIAEIPCAAICILAAGFQNISHHDKGSVGERKRRQLDVLGLTAFAFMMLCFLMILDLGARPNASKDAYIIFLAAGLLLSGAMFLVVEAYWANSPMISLRSLKNPSVGLQYLVQLLCMVAQFGVSIP